MSKEVSCPECGHTLAAGTLLLRVNGKTGRHFLGCSNWPHCNFKDNPGEFLHDELWWTKDEWFTLYRSSPSSFTVKGNVTTGSKFVEDSGFDGEYPPWEI